MRALGVDQAALKRDAGLVFAVRRVEADYLSPARFDDELQVETAVEAVSPARITLSQQVRRGDDLLFAAKVTLVAMDLAGKPQRLPEVLRRA